MSFLGNGLARAYEIVRSWFESPNPQPQIHEWPDDETLENWQQEDNDN